MTSPTEHPSQQVLVRTGARLPVVQGGMTFGSDGRLVAAVCEAGGLGTLGTFHYRTYDRVMPQVELIRNATERKFAVNVPFFENNFELVEALVRQGGVRCLTLGGWFSAEVEALKAEFDLTILVSVNSPTIARMVEERPVDVLIVQGNESGGANSHYTTRQLFDLIRPTTSAPILLAGGQWDGADLYRALQLGAGGIQLGTRFFFSEESPLHESIKKQVIRSNSKRPVTTTLSPVKDTLNMRFITNKPFKKAVRSGEIQEIFNDKEKVFTLSEAFFEEQSKPVLIYAGAAVYKLKELQSCDGILGQIRQEYRDLAAGSVPTL